MTHILNYALDWMFEERLCKYGSRMSVNALYRIFNAHDIRVNELNPVKAGHCISEGSKAMAKVARNILNDIPSKAVHLICDCTVIYFADQSGNKVCFITFLIGSALLTLFKIYMIYRSMKYVRKISLAAVERDKLFQEALDRADIVKGYCVEREFIKRIQKSNKLWVRNRKPYKLHIFSGDFFYKTFTVLFRLIVCMVFITHSNGASAIRIAMLIKILMDTVKTLEKSSEMVTKMVESVAEAEQIMGYLYLTQEDVSRKFIPRDFCDKLEIRNIRYAVSGGKNVIFDGANMVIRAGEKAALFGKNGTGKSSLFKIILNQVEFGGSVLYDEIKNVDISRVALHSLTTFVPQNTVLMDGTILYNIQMHNDVSYEEVIEICREMNIHDTICKFPDGYNTEVGEGGRWLNGGLKQKIFYARAFLRKSPIFLFDEPTNNLDHEHASQFIEYILESEKHKNSTIIVICHEAEYVTRFPCQYKLENRKVIKVK
ncbi:MSBA [Enterospora canceri]|uniref:MSBA n=1 Tax=Enterospora canceri TaxID=1081671 RepID=A0A1Y1S540_9MICR|nr:MSBA [Enterospora canceri]